jgi:hypothetical protein
MRSERRGGLHRHAALVTAEPDVRPSRPALTPAATGISLLCLSVPARLAMVAIAAAMLWVAVLWALR